LIDSEIVCPLCLGQSHNFLAIREREFLQCDFCLSIFLKPQYRLSLKSEKERYLKHQNDVNDLGYQNFVSPLVSAVVSRFTPSDAGLDFGAGTAPVTSKLLQDRGFTISQYDPFFWKSPEVLTRTYDYIVCCEVVEHFYQPRNEFELLRNLLSDKGVLFCMTSLYGEELDFAKWYYKDDSTHVFFYHKKAIDWICKNYKFSSYAIDRNLIEFRR
jgi:hypothetical protein